MKDEIGKMIYNEFLKDLYPIPTELIADMDSIMGGEFSRFNQESIRAALAPVTARAEAAEAEVKCLKAEVKCLKAEVATFKGLKLKEVEARVADEIAGLRRDLEDARAAKGPGGR
jgi:hypothetical protein